MAKKRKQADFVHCKVTETANPRAPWRVWFSTEDNGQPKRVFKSFATEDAARQFAEEKELEISNHGIRYGDIPPEVRRAFDFYRDERMQLETLGASVPRFEDLVSRSLAAIRTAHQMAEANSVSVAEGIETFLDYKRPRVKHRQLADLTDRLKRFARDYGDRPMPSIATQEIDAWLSGLRSLRNPQADELPPLLGPLSRNHYRAALNTFFTYASTPARAWCERNPVSDLDPEVVRTGEPEAYTPEDVLRLMQTALDSKPGLVPVLALGFFAGLRKSECEEFDLGSLMENETELRVSGDRKTGARLAPYTDACRAWLAAQPRRTGKAWQKSPRTLVDEMQELHTLAGVKQISNGARHSFISYRTAETRDIARVSDECGTGISNIRKHYRQLVTGEAAEKYFSIRPMKQRGRKSKVTNIEAGRVSA